MARLITFTGAGLSAESGIPTFRDRDGMWENYDVQKIAFFPAWKQNYDLVHRFYNERRVQMKSVEPNPAHHMLAEWSKKYHTINYTQNIDDLLVRAGCENVVRLHGDIYSMRCVACGHVFPKYDEWNETDRCPNCDSRKGVKPGVIFFGENAPEYPGFWKTIGRLQEDDVVVVIGTSAEVIPIHLYTQESPAYSICINPKKEYEDSYDIHITKKATKGVVKADKLIAELIEGTLWKWTTNKLTKAFSNLRKQG